MTMTDDALVRELAARADAAAPAMSLDPTAVLAAGRHRRRRRAHLQVAAAAAVVVAGLGLVQVLDDQGGHPVAADTVGVAGVTATAVSAGIPVQTAAGPGIDVGTIGDAGGNRFTMAADASGAAVYVQRPGSDQPEPLAQVLGAHPGGAGSQSIGPDGSVTVVGFAAPGDHVTLDLKPVGGGSVVLPVPLLELPGTSTRAYAVHLSGTPTAATLPRAVLTSTGDAPWQLLVDLRSLIRDDYVDGDGIEVSVARDVHGAAAAGRTAVDTGVTAPQEWLDDASASSTTPVFVVRLQAGDPREVRLEARADGRTVTSKVMDEDQWLSFASPLPMVTTWDRGAVVLGAIPAGAHAATLLVNRSSGEDRFELPTFRVPGLESDVFLVVLADTVAQPEAWPAVSVEITYDDGTTARWTLQGDRLG